LQIPRELYEYKLLAKAVLLLAVEDLKRRPEWTEDYRTARMLIYPINEELRELRDLWIVLALLPEDDE
jgi:hypothetical protein